MPDALPFVGVFVVGPSGYPASPVPTRIASEEAVWPDETAQFERPYTQSWPLATRLRPRRVRLTYVLRTRADFNTIRNHWDSTNGMEAVFSWTHPVTGEKWKARYGMDRFDYPEWRDDPDLLTFATILEEVPF